jgi:diguanylate cyclase (GGDEF)-like protein
VAQILKQIVNGPFYFAARYGGEEFVIVLPGADITQAAAFAEHLRLSIQGLAIPIQGNETVVGRLPDAVLTVSLGVASTIPQAQYTILDLLKAADRALYTAKQTGRNRVCLATDPDFSVVHPS